MKEKKIKSNDLAEMLGMGRSTLSLKLNGRRAFRQEEIDKLLEIFNKPYEFLMIRSDKK
jgi:transcriptional regulator with XRE-family HTH domain